MLNIAEKTPSSAEQRVFSRIDCFVDLELSDDSNAFNERVEAIDLSLLGVGFKRRSTSPQIREGDTLVVKMYGLPPIRGQVRWNDGLRVGLQFCGRFQEIVESWVGEVLAAQGVTVSDLVSSN